MGGSVVGLDEAPKSSRLFVIRSIVEARTILVLGGVGRFDVAWAGGGAGSRFGGPLVTAATSKSPQVSSSSSAAAPPVAREFPPAPLPHISPTVPVLGCDGGGL